MMVRVAFLLLLFCVSGHINAQEVKIEKSKELVVIGGKSFYLHTVQPKQTLFSICKAYGVSVDEVKALNGKQDNALSVGEVLQIPHVEPFKRVDDKYYYHRMRPKETLYSLSRKFDIKLKRILKENPEYDVSRPIAEGAVVRLPLRQIDRGVLEAELRWLDRQEQEAARREKEEATHVAFYPPARDSLDGMIQQVVGDTTFVIPEVAFERHHVKVALLLPLSVKDNKLPFSAEEIPVDTLGVNIRDERWRLSEKSAPFLQFYGGVLMAADSLKRLGYTIDLHVYDTERDVAATQAVIGELNQLSPDLIIGPVYANTYKLVAEQLQNRVIPMIYPLSSRAGELARFPNFVQMNICNSSLVEEMAGWVSANSREAHLINIIPDGNARSGEESRLPALIRAHLQGEIAEPMVDYRWRPQMHVDSVRKVLRPGVENIIIFPTLNEAAASRTLPVLSALADHFKITVIGFPEWLKFTSIDEEMFYKLNVKIMANSYVDYQGKTATSFSAKHREYFYSEPNNIANRAFDMALYFIPLVEKERTNTLNSLRNSDAEGMFTRFRFRPMGNFGGLENRGLYLIHYDSKYNIIVTPLKR
ncbi:amino acid ABC transporter substrate-binding protein [Butyricimonas synergistica]|uniref:amino acid ABC transporter substrate-binding protein n=1 Tax=Butyricimonas synergistica TaxID=544644 RepID=UPI00037FDE1B|nr:LysM peptidoglycan-binding domain-containing protein [Butyricimonas synergistica]